MKQLFIIRHAKSSWALPEQIDFDRSLNDRGRKDAPLMAQRLLANKIEIDFFMCSSANRTMQTAACFAEVFRISFKKIVSLQSLYHATPAGYYAAIATIPNDIQSAAIFGHNPGITEFANELTETHIDNMPTCSIFGVQFEGEDWQSFQEVKKSFLIFDYPKL